MEKTDNKESYVKYLVWVGRDVFYGEKTEEGNRETYDVE